MRIDQIRHALAPIHTAIEQTPVATAMIGGTVTRDDYVAMLGQLGVIHAALESALASVDHPLYRPAEMARADVIGRDLAALGSYDDVSPSDATERLVSRIETWRDETPWALLGALYVLEGSRMGSLALVRPVAKALGVDVRAGTGVDYHLDGMATRPMAWGRFKGELMATPLDETQLRDVAAAAVETMSALFELYAGPGAIAPEPAAVLAA